jgi:hypothetical protein
VTARNSFRMGLAGLVLVVGLGLAATADAATWRTAATASDTSSWFTYASLSRETGYGTRFLRARTRGPRGWVNVDGSIYCHTLDYERSGSRTFGWRYRSSGYRAEVNTRRLPVPVPGGKCDVWLSADGNGGRIRVTLQTYR